MRCSYSNRGRSRSSAAQQDAAERVAREKLRPLVFYDKSEVPADAEAILDRLPRAGRHELPDQDKWEFVETITVPPGDFVTRVSEDGNEFLYTTIMGDLDGPDTIGYRKRYDANARVWLVDCYKRLGLISKQAPVRESPANLFAAFPDVYLSSRGGKRSA